MGLWEKFRNHLEKPYRDKSLKEALYLMIFESDTKLGQGFDIVLIFFIIASIINVILESVEPFATNHYALLHDFEYFFTGYFTLEYIFRIYCSPHPKKYIFSFFGVIDFLAILPIYLSIFVKGGNYLIVMRAFRLIRIFRVFKLFSFLKQGDLLLDSIKMSLPKIVVFFCFIVIMVISIGTVMYVVEGSQPHTGFKDIPTSIYWAIVTMTTVGYGDITPVTALGRFISALVMLMGYTIIAVPTGIVSATMLDKTRMDHSAKCPKCEKTDNDKNAFYCKYCGAPLNPAHGVSISKPDDKNSIA